MPDEERRALGRARRLAFQNVANGVPDEQIMSGLRMSQLELDQAVQFVARKIVQHLVLRRQPPIDCGTRREIRWNRRPLLAVLARIGDLDLSTSLILKVSVQALDHPEMIEGARHRMTEAYR